MSNLPYYYNTYTGYGYSITEHAKLRIWERFKTMDIDREFSLYYKLLINDTIDRIVVANMDIGDEAIIKNCFNNKVYVVVLTTDLTIQLKTVYRDSYYRQFMPYAGQTMFRLYKDGTVHRYIQYYQYIWSAMTLNYGNQHLKGGDTDDGRTNTDIYI